MSNNVTNSIPATLNDLLVKLKILSMIERGKKINMGTMTLLIPRLGQDLLVVV